MNIRGKHIKAEPCVGNTKYLKCKYMCNIYMYFVYYNPYMAVQPFPHEKKAV